MERKKRYFLFGSEHVRRLGQVLAEDGCVVGQFLGVSPLSDVDSAYSGSEPALSSWHPKLKEEMFRAEADCIVLDLHTASQKLFSVFGHLLSGTNANASLIRQEPVPVVNPSTMDDKQLFSALDRFIDALYGCFNYRQIILVHTNLPEFYWIGTAPRMRNNFASYSARQQWYDRLEQYFAEKTHCHVVDVTRHYFHQKEAGRPMTELVYEDRCYRDVADRVRRICRGEAVGPRPNFRYSLQRYAQGKFTLYLRFATVFLDKDYLLDSLILSAHESFVEKNMEDLVALDALDWTDVDAALKAMDGCGASEGVRKVMYAFAKTSAGVYDDPQADYPAMFQSRVVPARLVDALQQLFAGKDGLLTGQINQENAGFYFAKMKGLDPAPYMTEATVVKPVVVDVYGSCISRTTFNVAETDFAVNRYWFQIPPLFGNNATVSYPEDMFPEKPHWADRLVRDQFNGVIPDQMAQSFGQWLVVDLYTFVSVIQFRYKDCYYTDYNTRISKLLGAEKVMVCDDPSVLGTWEEILVKMEGWFQLVRQKYGNRVILINGQRSDYWIGDDDLIYRKKERDGTTPYLDQIFRDVAQRLDCYCIDTYKPFLPDEGGYISNTPAHKETDCYRYAHELIRMIIAEEPEQKYYSDIPGAIQFRRLKRLLRKNSPQILEQVLGLSELERCVIRLEPEVWETYSMELEELYDAGLLSLEELEPVCTEESGARLLAVLKAAKAKGELGSDEVQFHENYEPYSETCPLIGLTDLFPMPLFRRIELRELVCDRNRVRLMCVTARDTPVVVYRRSACSDWKVVARGTAGYIFDTEAAPLTEYWYVVCTEAEVGGKRYISNFTQPQRIVTGVATPALTRVTTLDGQNYLTWDRVEGADGYYIYRRNNETEGWFRCATVPGDVGAWDEPAENGIWYTIRAFRGTGANQVASNHLPGTKAEPL